MTTPKPRERVAVRYEATTRGYLELRVRSYDPKDPDIAGLLVSERVYVREDVAKKEIKSAAAVAEVAALRVALCDIGRIRACLASRAAGLRRIGEEARAMGVEDAIKQIEEEILG